MIEDFFTNPFKTYLEEKYKEEDLGHLWRDAEGRLVPKANGYHKWNPLKKAFDWIPEILPKGYTRSVEMKRRPEPRTPPTDVIFQKSSDKLAPQIAAAIKAAEEEREHKRIRQQQIRTKDAQLIIKRQNQIDKNSTEISKNKKNKNNDWFGEEKISEGIFGQVRYHNFKQKNPDFEDERPEVQDKPQVFRKGQRIGTPFDRKTTHPHEVLNWLHSQGIDPHEFVQSGGRIRWAEPKPTVHEELFRNPYKTIDEEN